ncbi:hypothetical protein G7Y79_00055g089760 [Physcia stellaris]|nr:hypothetical protein G7Y79_00055g089760 [Physcia stellaris]
MRSAYLPIAVSSCVLFFVSGLAAVPHRRDIASHQHRRYHGNGSTIQATHQFPPNTWLENLAVRSNGQVLVTLVTSPDLYLVDPSKPDPVLVHKFTNHLSLLGIAELEHDIFYVIAANYSQPDNHNTPGACAVYQVDMCKSPPSVALVAHFPKAVFLNGMAVLSKRDKLLLVGDAGAGVIYRLDAKTGDIAVVMDDPLMKPPKGAPVGLDGVQIRDKNLYYSNAPLGLLVRTPLCANGTAAGPAKVILRDVEIDDFTFDAAGQIYLAVFFKNLIMRLTIGDTNATSIAGPSKWLAGPTACKFGRDKAGDNMLYVTTNGGLGIGDASKMAGGTLTRIGPM